MDAKHTSGEPRALISRSALLHNAALLRRAVGDNVKLCAMLKADAYGHGIDGVVDALCNFIADGVHAPAVDALAVATVDEAVALPDTRLPVFICRPVENAFLGRQRAKLELAIRNGWTLTLCSASAADDVARIALAIGKRAAVQVMIDTGMARAGVAMAHVDALLDRISSHASLKLIAVGTHFACASDPRDPFTAEQLARFHQAVGTDARHRPLIRHAANSAALFFLPDSRLDMVRPGISLYGIDPTGRPCMDRTFRPALRWTAPLIGIRELQAGDHVGYDRTWTATGPARIGLVPVGYADGYLRCFSNRAVMILHGKPAPVIGRVSMDYTTIDLRNAPQATIGDEVILLDSDPLSPASVYELARLAETIPYEIFTRIGPRIPRIGIEPEDAATLSAPGTADAGANG